MEIPKIDESKLPAVMKLIDDAARLMEDTDCCFDETAVEARKNLIHTRSSWLKSQEEKTLT